MINRLDRCCGPGFLNVVAVAYSYGKMSQKVNDLEKRLKRIEKHKDIECEQR